MNTAQFNSVAASVGAFNVNEMMTISPLTTEQSYGGGVFDATLPYNDCGGRITAAAAAAAAHAWQEQASEREGERADADRGRERQTRMAQCLNCSVLGKF